MRLRGALSVPREKLLEFKADAFKELLQGILTVTRLNFPRVRQELDAYLFSLNLLPDDNHVLAWLNDHPGPVIAIYLFEDRGRIRFELHAGTPAELRQIGESHVEESMGVKGASSIREVNVGQGARVVQPGVIQEG
jgi:hypothetical protein